MEEIWIIGFGRFGRIAYERLSGSKSRRCFTLVDPVGDFSGLQGPCCAVEQANGPAFLERELSARRKPDWIIPALPVHLAAEWILLHLGPDRLSRIHLPPELDRLLPNPIRGPEGNIYVSHADFICPDDCPEPPTICTVTGKPRKQNMFDLLAQIDLPPLQPVVIRSRQLAPGVGGYRTDALMNMLSLVEQASGPVMLGTACRCHGVVTGVRHSITS